MVAKQQSLSSSIHTAKSRRENARQGYFNGEEVPFGYASQTAATFGKKNRKKQVLVPEEAEIVKDIFDWSASGRGGRWIANTLNSPGKTLRGKKFSNSSVSDVIKRDHYRGLIVTELVINSLKHAFPSMMKGTIAVEYSSTSYGWTLKVKDDGVGMAVGSEPVKPGLGTGIVDALAKQLGAAVTTTEAHPGTCVTITQI